MNEILIVPENLEKNIEILKSLRSQSENDIIEESLMEKIEGYTNDSVYELLLEYNTLKNNLLTLMDNTITFMEKTKSDYTEMDIDIANIFNVIEEQ